MCAARHLSSWVKSRFALVDLACHGVDATPGGLTRLVSRQALSGSSGRVVAGDLDGDGRLDAMVGPLWGVQVMLGQGGGSLGAAPTGLGNAAAYSLGLWKGIGGGVAG
jgi:hypothetical protein